MNKNFKIKFLRFLNNVSIKINKLKELKEKENNKEQL